MALNDIIFKKTHGGIGRPAANEDVISGLILDVPGLQPLESSLTEHFDTVTIEDGYALIARIKYPEQLTDFGITATKLGKDKTSLSDEEVACNAIVYHVSEFFRINPEGVLYLMLNTDTKIANGSYLRALQTYAGGNIRQAGMLVKKIDATYISSLQTTATELETEHTPLSVICTYNGENSTRYEGESGVEMISLSFFESEEGNLISKGNCNVSLLIAADLDNELLTNLGSYGHYGCIGAALGAISKAQVHESIAWVEKFPLSLKAPGFISGDLVKDVPMNKLNAINDNRYIFVRTFPGDANNYFNDSFTLDEPTSDYAYIEAVRTIDKACRGVRQLMLPYLGSPLYVDSDTGKLSPTTAAFLETTAGRALESMERAGELSGYKVEIDREQNVLATSQLEVVIKKVGVGVMRRVNIKIGYTTKL